MFFSYFEPVVSVCLFLPLSFCLSTMAVLISAATAFEIIPIFFISDARAAPALLDCKL